MSRLLWLFFFFSSRRRHTRLTCDWSSDVCSSDLEDITYGRVFEDPATVSRVTLHYKSLQSEALPKGASRELIARVAEERWKATAPLTGASRAIRETAAGSASRSVPPPR